MRCMLIGGAGFMGEAITRTLLEKGVGQIRVLDLPERQATIDAIPGVEFVAGNYLDLEKHDAVFRDVDCVIYLSTDSHPEASMQDPERDALNNIVPAVRMMEACRHHGVQGIVFASSGGTIYGDGDGQPLREDHDKAPLSAYGVVKLAIEQYLQFYHSQFGLKTFSLRISNAYGPGQLKGAVIGSVARFLRNIVEGETIEIWGDGSIVRDYVYIDDIVDAFTRCVLKMDEMQAGSYNIGCGVGHSLNQVIEMASEITCMEARVEYQAARKFDVRSIVLDSSKMTRESGWRPQVDLAEGIKRMFEVTSVTDQIFLKND